MAFDTPGVYINYKTNGPLVVRAASTSTAVFIGPTVIGNSVSGSGASTVVTPSFVTSLTEYADLFSTAGARSGVVSLPTNGNIFDDTMGHALRGFFMNGGTRAYVVSTSSGTAAVATGGIAITASTDRFYRIDALSMGAWGNDVQVTLTQSAVGSNFVDIELRLVLAGEGDADTPLVERFIGVDVAALDTISSNIVAFTALPAAPGAPIATIDVSAAPATPPLSDQGNLAGGSNSNGTETSEMGRIFDALRDFDDISLIVFPDRVWDDDQADYATALAHCQAMKDRMTLIQLEDSTSDFSAVSVPLDKFAAVYYPRARVTLPIAGGASRTAVVNTTGHVAGIFARTDDQKGAWTAPAGSHASIAGVTELTVDISHSFQARMNPHNINALRYINGIPTVWGARTRDQGGIYEYIPVMRTAILIADSLRETLEKVVFAKNTEIIWANIKAGVSGFMDGLYAQGAFQGATPGAAYRVAVGLNETMTQADIRAGILRLNVAYAPAYVAEFIVIDIEQIFEPA